MISTLRCESKLPVGSSARSSFGCVTMARAMATCHTPKELFDLLADDYRTYVEIELTKGKRELTEDDVKEADALCKRYLDRWKEELE